MDEQVDRLVQKAWGKYQQTPPSQRLIIAISGAPGSGKSTLAATITKRFNDLATEPVAVFVPMDGYHLTRAQLSAMPDPETAHFRRGAAFTFDAESFVKLVRRVREPLTQDTQPILAPSFDHAVKDPVEDDITIPPSARIVVFEGNYLSLNKDSWKEIRDLVDESWFAEVDEEVAKERVAQRHFKAGITDSLEAGRDRAEKLDLVNGREIVKDRGRVDEIIVSKEDSSWTPRAQAVEM